MLRVPIVSRPVGAPAGRKREPFSPQDDMLIVEFLATENPSGENRKGNELWKRLEKNASKQWPRGPAHTAQSWRNRYVHDSNTFDARVTKYIQNARAKRKAERALEAAEGHSAKRRKLDGEQQQQQHQQVGNGAMQTQERVNGVEATVAAPEPAETVANGDASIAVAHAPSPPVSVSGAPVARDRQSRRRPSPEPEPAPAPAPKAAPLPSRPSLTAFRGARKSVTDLPAMAVASASESSANSTSSRSSGRSATSGKKPSSIQSGDASAEESSVDESRQGARAGSPSASIHSQGSDFSQHETMPGAFNTRRSHSPPRSQPLYPKLSPESDAAPSANESRSRQNSPERRPRRDTATELSDHRSSKSSLTGRLPEARKGLRLSKVSVAPPKANGSHAARKNVQVYDDDTEEDEPPAAPRKTTSARVLVSKDPFSNRRTRVNSSAGPAPSSSSGPGDKGEAGQDDDGDDDDDDDDMDYPVGPSANKGKGRAVDNAITTDVQHEASAGNVADAVAAPMKSQPIVTAESSPASSAPQSSPIERRLARSSSSAGLQPAPERKSSKAQLPPLRQRPSFSKPRDAPSPFASPNSSAPHGLFVRRSEARDLMRPGPERATKSSPVKPAYSLNAVPSLPGKRRRSERETTVEDDTPTTNGRHMKQAREFVVPQLPASISMPLPTKAHKDDQKHRRRQTFGGFPALDAIPDAGALLRSRERARRRSVRLSSASMSPHPPERESDEKERALRRMSDNHGFAPAIVRGVLAGVGDDLAAADAVLARMRREAEREAVRALNDIVGEEFEVETSPAPVDLSHVPEVDFSSIEGTGHRRRTTGKWAAAVEQEQEQELEEEEEDAMEEDEAQEEEEEDEDEDEEDVRRKRFSREPWTAEEDRIVLTGSPYKALTAIEARRGVGAVALRLAQLL